MPELFTPFCTNFEINIILNAAEKLGWQWEILLERPAYLVELRKGDLCYRVTGGKTLGGVLSVNSSLAVRIAHNKFFTNQVLKKTIPFSTNDELFAISDLNPEVYKAILEKYTKVVVKPIDENNGVGITTSLTDVDALARAVDKVRQLGDTQVLIEQHVDATKEYRVIVWKGQTIDVLERIPAYVTGDGQHTVRQLIEQKNQYRLTEFNGIFEPINIDEDVDTLLAQKSMTIESIPPAGEHVRVETTCNLSQGGEVKRVELDQVHPAYLDMFQKMYQATWLNYCGADLITNSISDEPKLGRTVINELNGAPGFTLAFFDDVATKRPFLGATRILEMMEREPVRGL